VFLKIIETENIGRETVCIIAISFLSRPGGFRGGRQRRLKLELFEKTEIWIQPIQVKEVDLGLIAERVAAVLHLEQREVMVVDVRENLVTIDILKKSVDAERIIAKRTICSKLWRNSRRLHHPGDTYPLRRAFWD